MLKKSKSYLAIVESAKKLFWKHGIKKVTVEEISAEAGISKMTFYRHFANKEEVAELILKELMENGFADYEKIMAKPIPFNAKLIEIIDLKKASSKLISQEFMKDVFIQPDSKLVALIETQRVKSNKAFESDLKKAQQAGELRKDLKIEFIMYMLNSMSHLMEDEKLVDLFDDSEDLTNEVTNFFFYGMLQNGNS